MTDPSSPLSWSQIDVYVRGLPPRTNLVVAKTHLPHTPPLRRSRRGRAYGAMRQYRCHAPQGNLHVKEYPDRWVIHVDEWNPHVHPIRHLWVDRGYDRYFHLTLDGLLEAFGPSRDALEGWTPVPSED